MRNIAQTAQMPGPGCGSPRAGQLTVTAKRPQGVPAALNHAKGPPAGFFRAARINFHRICKIRLTFFRQFKYFLLIVGYLLIRAAFSKRPVLGAAAGYKESVSA
jgi:hypothetical protein